MKQVLSGIACLAALAAGAQYRYDNKQFTTVYPEEICQVLKANPDRLLLDVRSKGEYYDTSAAKSLNIGHFAGAQNIDIRELANRWHEIEGYKDKPIFIYCSHSQRSRRAAKMLADSGFTKVYNINGGLTTFRFQNRTEACPELAVQTTAQYKLLSPSQLAGFKGKPPYTVIDVRPDSVFKGIALDPRQNALGRLSYASNVPFSTFATAGASLPKNQPILLVDDFGNESVKAAEWLLANGYSDVTVLFNGMDALVTELPQKQRPAWTSTVPFQLINAATFDEWAKGKKLTLIDLRTPEEFNNNAKDTWRNIGQLKGAINIPAADLSNQLPSLTISKTDPIVVYALSSQPEVFRAAQSLSDAGYKNVSVLLGGLFNLRWRGANLKGYERLSSWVVNVPPDNQ